ncbi:hypothetical protein [Moraxella lacunata]|uniref:hypothetical protein n=1 Tax=Moraxella lacunata TaxID=477 RepID=UPI003EE15667
MSLSLTGQRADNTKTKQRFVVWFFTGCLSWITACTSAFFGDHFTHLFSGTVLF